MLRTVIKRTAVDRHARVDSLRRYRSRHARVIGFRFIIACVRARKGQTACFNDICLFDIFVIIRNAVILPNEDIIVAYDAAKRHRNSRRCFFRTVIDFRICAFKFRFYRTRVYRQSSDGLFTAEIALSDDGDLVSSRGDRRYGASATLIRNGIVCFIYKRLSAVNRGHIYALRLSAIFGVSARNGYIGKLRNIARRYRGFV